VRMKSFLKCLFALLKVLTSETWAVLRGEISFPHYLWSTTLTLSAWYHTFKSPSMDPEIDQAKKWWRSLPYSEKRRIWGEMMGRIDIRDRPSFLDKPDTPWDRMTTKSWFAISRYWEERVSKGESEG